jgi:hypothetical protein
MELLRLKMELRRVCRLVVANLHHFERSGIRIRICINENPDQDPHQWERRIRIWIRIRIIMFRTLGLPMIKF